MRFPRTNPIKVKPASLATAMPESIAAAKDATIGKLTLAALMIMSPVNLPLNVTKHSLKSVLFKAPMPITLSTALWRPTSSAKATRFPLLL